MTWLGFKDTCFDGLTAFYSLIHVPREKHSSLLQNFQRILKTNGIMLVCMGGDRWEGEDEYYGAKMFWSHYDPEKSLQLVKDTGYKLCLGNIL